MADLCGKKPALRMLWPGEDWKLVCEQHARMAAGIAQTLGFHLVVVNDAPASASCAQHVEKREASSPAVLGDPNVCGVEADSYVFTGHLGADAWFPLCDAHMRRAQTIAFRMKWNLFHCVIASPILPREKCQFTLSKRETADRIGRALVQPDPDAQVKP